MKKLKCYPIMIAKQFPATHPRKGDETCFSDLIYYGIKKQMETGFDYPHIKIHTIRKNYPLWVKRIKEVQDGKAYLSLRQWEGRPYHSNQVEFMRLTAADGVGIEKALFSTKDSNGDMVVSINGIWKNLDYLPKNDGLTTDDFKAWFTPIPTEPLAIIHFTKFRYSK